MIGIVKNVRFTSGSPFGEQYWTFDVDGKEKVFAMWVNFNSPLWAKTGQTVEIEEMKNEECYTGFGGKINLDNCGKIIRIIN